MYQTGPNGQKPFINWAIIIYFLKAMLDLELITLPSTLFFFGKTGWYVESIIVCELFHLSQFLFSLYTQWSYIIYLYIYIYRKIIINYYIFWVFFFFFFFFFFYIFRVKLRYNTLDFLIKFIHMIVLTNEHE